jgi:hypothetical protein
MSKKFLKNKLYKIRFYDHCIGRKSKMVCEVVGWVIEDDTEHVVLTPWIVDTDEEDVKRDNVEPYSIIKSCIIRKRKLV